MRAKFVNERFSEHSDPVDDLEIGGMVSKIKKLFNSHFSKYGELDFKFDEALKNIFVFIPYKSRSERIEIQNLEFEKEHINSYVDDILRLYDKELWSTKLYRAKSWSNKTNFHTKDRGLVYHIITCNWNDDPEREW